MKLRKPFGSFAAALALVMAGGLSVSAYAQDGYHIGESGAAAPQSMDAPQDQAPAAASTENSGPVRIARFSYVSGNVTWRPDGDTDWTAGTVNTPMRQGAQVWVGDGGRAELQFDDGSVIRLGSGAVLSLETLFSDTQGEFTELKMTDGLASMDLRTDHSIYQIDTPHGSVKSVGPSRVRVGVDEDVEIGVREGSATLDGAQGKMDLHTGDYVDVRDDSTPYAIAVLPGEDSWDKFTDDRHALMTHVDPNLPENMQYVAGDIDNYGTWRDDAQYGRVWCPNESATWQPYHDGNWVWCDPFGWTWVGTEPWGWAPYHYGSWVHRRWGWGWAPGPRYQYWSPGVVSFSYYGSDVCWAPLAPAECVYPGSFGVGFYGLGWGAFFSIGCCGVWSPYGAHGCYDHPWNSAWVNHWHGWDHGFGHGWDPNGSVAFSRQLGGAQWSTAHFVPSNARFGATATSVSGFGGRGAYQTLSGQRGVTAFTEGRVAGVTGRGEPMSGPVAVARPSANSWSPTRTAAARTEEGTGIMGRQTIGGTTARGSVQRYSSPTPFGSHYSSGASAAAAARQSLGWTPRSGGTSGSTGSRSSFGGTSRSGSFGSSTSSGFGSRSAGSSGTSRTTTTGSSSSRGGGSWGIQDHSGWSHVHSDNSRGGSHSSSGSSGGSRGGGGSGGGGGTHHG
jgi:hypothetical protein